MAEQTGENLMSVEELCRKHDCISFDEFSDAFNKEITQQSIRGDKR